MARKVQGEHARLYTTENIIWNSYLVDGRGDMQPQKPSDPINHLYDEVVNRRRTRHATGAMAGRYKREIVRVYWIVHVPMCACVHVCIGS